LAKTFQTPNVIEVRSQNIIWRDEKKRNRGDYQVPHRSRSWYYYYTPYILFCCSRLSSLLSGCSATVFFIRGLQVSSVYALFIILGFVSELKYIFFILVSRKRIAQLPRWTWFHSCSGR